MCVVRVFCVLQFLIEHQGVASESDDDVYSVDDGDDAAGAAVLSTTMEGVENLMDILEEDDDATVGTAGSLTDADTADLATVGLRLMSRPDLYKEILDLRGKVANLRVKWEAAEAELDALKSRRRGRSGSSAVGGGGGGGVGVGLGVVVVVVVEDDVVLLVVVVRIYC